MPKLITITTEIPDEQGIYVIRHRETRRIYIGSSISMKRRSHEHVKQLRKGKHCNRKLQNSWSKHGEEAFEFRVAQVVPDLPDLLFWEQVWIDKLKPHYNLDRIVQGGSRGRKLTDDQRAAMCVAQSKVIRDPAWIEAMRAKIDGMPASWWQERGEKVAAACARTFFFVSPGGELTKVINLAKFCRENGLMSVRMSDVWRGVRVKKHRGWRSGRLLAGAQNA